MATPTTHLKSVTQTPSRKPKFETSAGKAWLSSTAVSSPCARWSSFSFEIQAFPQLRAPAARPRRERRNNKQSQQPQQDGRETRKDCGLRVHLDTAPRIIHGIS